MPIYEYVCQDCGHEFEFLLRGDDKPVCPSCGRQRLSKSMSVPAAHSAKSNPASCPVKDSCGMSSCCKGNCGLGY